MREMSCKNCMEKIELVTITVPKTGEQDEEELWIMCDCKGERLGNPEDLNFPKTWVGVKKH